MLLGACNPYEIGYKDGRKDSFFYKIWRDMPGYRSRYADGKADAWRFEEGCKDAKAGREPSFDLKDNKVYKQGFRECS